MDFLRGIDTSSGGGNNQMEQGDTRGRRGGGVKGNREKGMV